MSEKKILWKNHQIFKLSFYSLLMCRNLNEKHALKTIEIHHSSSFQGNSNKAANCVKHENLNENRKIILV